MLYILEVRELHAINSFANRVLSGILADFFLIFGISVFGRLRFPIAQDVDVNFAGAYVEILVKRLMIFLGVVRLTPLNTLKLVLNFLINAVEKFKFFSFSFINRQTIISIKQFFSYKLTVYSTASLFSSDTFLKNNVLPATPTLSFDSFLTSYTRVKKRRRFKAILGLKVRRKYKP